MFGAKRATNILEVGSTCLPFTI